MAYDLIIRGGRVVDGSGLPSYVADVGVKDGKIVEVGRLKDGAARTIDAAGRRVARPFAGAASGELRHTWDAGRSPGGALPPGVYWARLTGNRNGVPLPVRIERFVLLR